MTGTQPKITDEELLADILPAVEDLFEAGLWDITVEISNKYFQKDIRKAIATVISVQINTYLEQIAIQTQDAKAAIILCAGAIEVLPHLVSPLMEADPTLIENLQEFAKEQKRLQEELTPSI